MDIYNPTQTIYYVYAYINKSTGAPYYIGMGKGKRAYNSHSYHGISTPKDKTKIVFLETNLSQVGAYALERRYIEWYGRKDLNTGILLNRHPGGSYGMNNKELSDLRKKQWNDPDSKYNSDETRNKYRELAIERHTDPNYHVNTIEWRTKQSNKIKELRSDTSSRYSNLNGNYIITDPNGVEYKVNGLKPFCREYGLESKYLARQANGRKTTPYKGWSCVYDTMPPIPV